MTPQSDIEDITPTLKAAGVEVADENTVFRAGTRWVKVKTFHDLSASGLGKEVLRFSGAECDARGKALTRADGSPQVQALGRHLVIGGEQDAEAIVSDIAAEQRACALETLRQADRGVALSALAGVKAVATLPPLAQPPLVGVDTATLIQSALAIRDAPPPAD